MATTLTPIVVSRAGSNQSLAGTAGASAMNWKNTGSQFLVIYNGNGSPCVVTMNFGTGGVVDGQTPTARTFSIPTLSVGVLGPFPPSVYNDGSGMMNIGLSVTATVTVAVYQPGS